MDDLARTAADLGTVLSIWAHPDDETYLSGGLMAAAAANGQRVVCVSATAGELGTDDPERWPPDRLARVRRWEAAAAMAVLGVDEHLVLGLPDGGLAALEPDPHVTRIVELIAEVRPDTILTFGPDGGTFHPDHQTVSRWVSDAWAATGRSSRLLHSAITEEHWDRWGDAYESWGIWMTDERPVPVPSATAAVAVRLAGHHLDQKVAALCAMHTQTAGAIALLGADDFREESSTESFVDAG